jgi:hypothetical protein
MILEERQVQARGKLTGAALIRAGAVVDDPQHAGRDVAAANKAS